MFLLGAAVDHRFEEDERCLEGLRAAGRIEQRLENLLNRAELTKLEERVGDAQPHARSVRGIGIVEQVTHDLHDGGVVARTVAREGAHVGEVRERRGAITGDLRELLRCLRFLPR